MAIMANICEVWLLTGFCKFGDACWKQHLPRWQATPKVAEPLTKKFQGWMEGRPRPAGGREPALPLPVEVGLPTPLPFTPESAPPAPESVISRKPVPPAAAPKRPDLNSAAAFPKGRTHHDKRGHAFAALAHLKASHELSQTRLLESAQKSSGPPISELLPLSHDKALTEQHTAQAFVQVSVPTGGCSVFAQYIRALFCIFSSSLLSSFFHPLPTPSVPFLLGAVL